MTFTPPKKEWKGRIREVKIGATPEEGRPGAEGRLAQAETLAAPELRAKLTDARREDEGWRAHLAFFGGRNNSA